jgi:hypothetical protein
VFGPDRLTPHGTAEVISQELGRPVAYHRVTPEDYGSMLRSRGAGDQAVQDVTEAFVAQDHGIHDADRANAKPAATGFPDLVPEVLKPAAEAHES